MSKALRTIGAIAATVALVAGAIATSNPAFLKLGAKTLATLKTVASVAAVTAGVAQVGSQLTTPKPVARGSPATLVIDVEPPRPYIVGEVMAGGVLRHDVAYGPTLGRVPNPFRWQVRVLSGVGPIQGFVGDFFDFEPIGSFYSSGFLNISRQLGQRPEATALVPGANAPAPGWGPSSKLSGCAAVGLNFLFDRDGERYARGLPIYTALCQGEKVYDPRQDSTYPGGSGPCRLGQENTYVYSRNPACHAGTYAFGRFEDGKRLFGLGLSPESIDWPAVVDWANDCDTNGWTANIILMEGGTGANLREQRVRNLDDLCSAGGGRWFQAGAQMSFDWHRPRVSLATLTDEDILEAGGGTDAVQTVRERMNGVRPQYISPVHNWQQITAAEIVGSTYRTEDGTPLTQVWPLNGVTNPTQAGQLASYAMADSRELGPMDVQVKQEWRFYRPGDCITIDSSLVAYQGQAVINQRGLKPDLLSVSLSMKSETPGKHPFALGKVADPPPTPILTQTTEERDLVAAAAMRPRDIDAEPGATRTVARGTYDGATTYLRGDEVIFEGSTYRLIVETSISHPPPDVVRWALIAAAGSGTPGADGLPGLTILLSKEAAIVTTDKDGNGGDYSAAGGQMRLLRGTDVLEPVFSIPARTPTTSWISIDASTGVFTVSDPGVDLATATIRAAWAGVNYDRTYSLAKSRQGDDGTPAVTGLLTNENFTVFAFANGNVVSYAGATGNFRVFQGNMDVSSNFSLSTQANHQGLVVGYTGQTYTVSGGFANADDTASLTVRATGSGAFAGVTIDKVFTLAKTRGGYEIVGSLPATNLFAGRVVFLTSDNKLYRYTGSAWTTAVPAPDITGQLTDAQIAALAAAKLTGQITTTQITDNAISTPKLAAGAVTADQIAANTILASKLVLSNNDDVFPDTGFRDLPWHNLVGLGTGNDASGSGSPARFFQTATASSTDRFSSRVTIERGATYRVTLRLFVPSSAAGFFASSVHFPFVSWLLPGSNGAIDGGGYPIIDLASVPRDQWLTFTAAATTHPTADAILELRYRWDLTAGFVSYAFEVVRASDANLIVDGAVTATKVAANAIVADKIAAGAVTAGKIAVSELSAITANIGDITAGLLRSSNDQARIELNNARIIFNNGSFMKVTGIGFGSSNQFIEWSGPSQANLANCTEANAVSYLKVNGEAYFGGSLSAGARKNAIQGTGTADNAEVILGPFGSVSGSRVVVSSFGFLWAGQHTDTGVGAGSSSSTATLILERRTGGAWTQVVSFNVTINKTWTQSFGPGEPGTVTITGNGSNTTTDTAEITTNMEYRLRLSARPLPAGGPTPDGQISQTLGIISTQG